MDLFSRKIVGWEVHETESAVHSSDLVQRTVWKEGCIDQPLVLHGDNGSPIKGQTVQVMLGKLGITASFSQNNEDTHILRGCGIFPRCSHGEASGTGGRRAFGYQLIKLCSIR